MKRSSLSITPPRQPKRCRASSVNDAVQLSSQKLQSSLQNKTFDEVLVSTHANIGNFLPAKDVFNFSLCSKQTYLSLKHLTTLSYCPKSILENSNQVNHLHYFSIENNHYVSMTSHSSLKLFQLDQDLNSTLLFENRNVDGTKKADYFMNKGKHYLLVTCNPGPQISIANNHIGVLDLETRALEFKQFNHQEIPWNISFILDSALMNNEGKTRPILTVADRNNRVGLLDLNTNQVLHTIQTRKPIFTTSTSPLSNNSQCLFISSAFRDTDSKYFKFNHNNLSLDLIGSIRMNSRFSSISANADVIFSSVCKNQLYFFNQNCLTDEYLEKSDMDSRLLEIGSITQAIQTQESCLNTHVVNVNDKNMFVTSSYRTGTLVGYDAATKQVNFSQDFHHKNPVFSFVNNGTGILVSKTDRVVVYKKQRFHSLTSD
ncbi:hypothetical protein DID75_04840 [Candidatus Marinamargulisbacteria bacterium SCGC AG-410-N11]|nr:hypothetical protein DID75_04840 [Candidatus Marinamargulisbacteria bacterium SCGC AG-410-N11]